MEGALRPKVALALIGFAGVPHDLAPDHLGQAGAGAQFVKESGGQAHTL